MFLHWKSGVEFKLYEFQLAQSGTSVPISSAVEPPQPLWEKFTDSTLLQTDHDWDQLDLDVPYTPNTKTNNVCPPRLPHYVPPTPLRVTDLEGPMQKHARPAAWTECATPSTKTLQQPMSTRKETSADHSPSKASEFMQTRPGGPRNIKERDLKVVERQVSAQLQRKATTSAKGKQALVALAQSLVVTNKKIQQTSTLNNKRKPGASRAPKVTPSKKLRQTTNSPSDTTKERKAPPKCKYGCIHGGWVELKQMMPYDTRYYLGKGNYLDGKHCVDCITSIGDIFRKSKNKALLYYCPVDYNRSQLCDENHAKEAKPCACILCITCYFKRENKIKLNDGKTKRSSGRGRK